MAKEAYILTIPNDTSCLSIVGVCISAIVTQLGLDTAGISDIRLVMYEACARIIETL
jgi:anti-sigma regulatory factor (Ser/Thr protein kinase)